MSNQRLRNWASIIYESSAPANWRSIIQSFHVSCVVSPVHDSDVYEEDVPDGNGGVKHREGDLKAPHRHVLWMFEGKKSAKQVLEMIAPLNGAKYVEQVQSVRGYSRYLCHLDEPQEGVAHPKAIYPISEIETFCGASIDLSKPLAGEELKRVRAEVLDWIRSTGCTEYADLIDHATDFEPDWIEYVCNKTTFLTGYLGSRRGKAKAMAEAAALLRVDPETGEVCNTDGQ